MNSLNFINIFFAEGENMRQKGNGKIWFYAAAAVVAALVLWVISREIPFTPETVEQPIENTFAR